MLASMAPVHRRCPTTIALLAFVLLACVPVASQPNRTTPVMPIFIDLSLVSGTPNAAIALTSTVLRAMSRTPTVANIVGVPRVYNTNGSILTALAQLQTIVGDGDGLPRLIAIADASAAITAAVLSTLRGNPTTENIIVVPLLSADAEVCDIDTYPNVVCVSPRDRVNVQAAFDLGYRSLRWRSVAVVVSDTPYGRGVLAAVEAQETATSLRPIVVAREIIGAPGDDDGILRRLAQNNPTIVLAFVAPTEGLRLRASQARQGLTALFWLWSKSALSLLPSLRGNVITHEAMTGALFVPRFALPDGLAARGVVTAASTVDPVMSMVILYLLDAVQLAFVGGADATATTLRRVVIDSPTLLSGNNISFDPSTGERAATAFVMISAVYQSPPIAKWERADVTSTPQDSLATFATTLVPPSPLRAVSLCILGSASCSDVADVARLMAVFTQANANRTRRVSIIAQIVNTGPQGVLGLPNLLAAAPSCQVALGPGRARVNLIVSPVLSYYQIPQVTYSLASSAFDNNRRFPLYTRVSGSDVDMALALASTAQFYAWGRVLVMSTDDEYGELASAVYVDAMETKTVLVERVYLISEVGAPDFFDALTHIQERAISRIIVVAMSMTDVAFDRFTAAFRGRGMLSTTIFMFSNPTCRYLTLRPALRVAYVSSMCAVPRVRASALREADQVLNATADSAANAAIDAALHKARIEAPDCPVRAATPFAAYTYDAAAVVLRAVDAGAAVGLDTFNVTQWVAAMRRPGPIDGVSGAFSLSSSGQRIGTELIVNVQEPRGVVTDILSYNSASRPTSVAIQPLRPIVWLDNTTDVPPASLRVVTFIAVSTLRDNPGTIVLSVLGFVGTIAVFVLCYRQYKTQLEVERRLNTIVAEQKYKDGASASPAPVQDV